MEDQIGDVGVSFSVIKADALDPDAEGQRICGLMCLNMYLGKKLYALAGVRPLFPARSVA